MRVAIYARYSSERQNERSIEDQVAVCTRHAEAQGWPVVGAFMDAAISGAAMVNRPGLLSALAAAERGDFDALLCEDEDRIARSLEHLAHVVNRLNHAGARLATTTNARVETLHVAFKGLIAEDYLRNLSAKTARGMRSNAEKGLATGSRLYGYRSQPGGGMEIVDAEAEVIRRIFDLYGAGQSPRAIAAALNAEHIPSPHGGHWNASSINGSRQRRNGILQSDIYAGEKVWNRWDMRKDPMTGRRVALIKPEGEWKRTPVPHLRIVSDLAWRTAQARKRAYADIAPHHQHRRPASLLSGLIKCGLCGASYTAAHGARLRCSSRMERGDGACSNRRTIVRAEIERRVLETLRNKLLSPAAIRAYVRAYHRLWEARKGRAAADRSPLEKRLAELVRRIDRSVEAILEGVATPALKARLMEMEGEKADIESRLAVMDAAKTPIDLHPAAAEGYAGKVEQLQAMLASPSAGQAPADLVNAIRDLIERVVVTPQSNDRAAPIKVELHGRIAQFVQGYNDANPHESMSKVVAGGRIELPT